MIQISRENLINTYDVFLLDAYGVLVDAHGTLPGAQKFLQDLRAADKAYCLVTNDASKDLAALTAKYEELSLPIGAHQICSSGLLLAPYVQEHRLMDAHAFVLGPQPSKQLAMDAGLTVCERLDDSIEILVIADEAGYDFLPTMDAVTSFLMNRASQGALPHLVLLNPDLIYPKGAGEFGWAAGSIALAFEENLKRFVPRAGFTKLGKPHTPIFKAALKPFSDKKVVMLGDQLHTDVLGANQNGIDACLVGTGLTTVPPNALGDLAPKFWLADLL
tara:strand:- start:245 stop:1069 length:825 start_codon:yes stop_codon:yes gene_type:complete